MMERVDKGRSSRDCRPRPSTSSERAVTSSSATTGVYSSEAFGLSNISAANRRRHGHQISLPHNQLSFALDRPHHPSGPLSPLSPFEERLLGRAGHPVGIPLADPPVPPPTVTGKILSSVKRAVSLKREKTSPVEESFHPIPSFSSPPPPPPPTLPQENLTATANVKRTRTLPTQSIITAHRSPFGGYTTSGDFVVTRTTDGRRLPVPQPHPHAHRNSRIAHPPAPAHSALRKNSTISIESGDSYTLVTTPDSASTVGSVNGGTNPGLPKNRSMFARLMGKGHKRSLSASMVPSELDVSQSVTKKAVRFTVDSDETSVV